MPRAYHRLFWAPLWLGLACTGDGMQSKPTPQPGPDCTALAQAAQRAEGCDPELGRLAKLVLAEPDETTCRHEARRLLREPQADSRIHSVYEHTVVRPELPLTDQEQAALRSLPLPGILSVKPNLPRQPGRPTTSVWLGDHPVDMGEDGRFLAHVAPGEHTITIRHAGAEQRACVRLEACERVELTAHGSRLAPHDRVNPRACRHPGLEVAASDP